MGTPESQGESSQAKPFPLLAPRSPCVIPELNPLRGFTAAPSPSDGSLSGFRGNLSCFVYEMDNWACPKALFIVCENLWHLLEANYINFFACG